MTSLELRAEACVASADELLHNPDIIQIMGYQSEFVDGDLTVTASLNSIMDNPKSISWRSRFLNFANPNDADSSTRVLLNIDELREGTPEQNLSYYNSSFINRDNATVPELLELALKLGTFGLSIEEIARLQNTYIDFISSGRITTTSYRKIVLPSGETIDLAARHDSQGIFDDVTEFYRYKIAVLNPRAKIQTVLQQQPDGSYESFREIADLEARLHPLLDDEDKIRNINGDVIGFITPRKRISAMENAERQMGARILTGPLLNEVEVALELIQNLDREEN